MKNLTTWRRLNTAFWLLVVLLLAGVGLALWVADARSMADKRSEQLVAARGNIAYQVVLISDTVRGLLLDPRNEPEKRHMREAEADLASELQFLQSQFADYPDLMRSVSSLSDFTLRTLADFHRQVLDMAETDSAGAVMLYVRDYPEIRNTRSKLFTDLTYQVERVRNTESMHGKTLALLGLTPIAIILLAIPVVGRVHSSTVTRPLEQPGGGP